ncbi:MAG: copper transport protein [Frankiales bacterium]|nr:copper transport protein [Frankiales bacterium]
MLTSAPGQLTLRFSESIEAATTHLDIVGSDGATHQPTSVQVVSAGGSGSGPVLLVVGLPPLPADAYRVSWQTVSSDDLHQTNGILVFGVRHPVTAAGLHEPPPALPESALRWLLFLALATTLGGTLLAALFRPDASGPFADAAVRRCRGLALAGSVVALGVSLALLRQQMYDSGESLSRLLPSTYGHRWLVREAGLAALVPLMYSRLRGGFGPTAQRFLRWFTAAAATLAAVGSALLGHAGAGATPSVTRVGADAAHVLAAAVWAGTLLVAAVVVVPRLRPSGGEAVTARAALGRFAVPAAICVAVMAVTGVYLTSGVAGSVDAVLMTTYGRVLIAKVALVCVAGALGLANSAALHPGVAGSVRSLVTRRRPAPAAEPRRPRHLVPEALVAASVLALSAVLTSGQPAREPQLVSSTAGHTVPVLDGAAADLQETLAVQPNLPGANVLLVGVFDTRRPSPGVVRGVQVAIVGADGAQAVPLALTPLADGRWSAPASLTASGAALVRVTVHRQGLPDASSSYRWVVGGSPSLTRPAVLSTAPIANTLRVAAGGLAVLIAVPAGFVVASRRRSRRGRAAVPSEATMPAREEVSAGH